MIPVDETGMELPPNIGEKAHEPEKVWIVVQDPHRTVPSHALMRPHHEGNHNFPLHYALKWNHSLPEIHRQPDATGKLSLFFLILHDNLSMQTTDQSFICFRGFHVHKAPGKSRSRVWGI
jgi:hypothetical protein